MSTSKANQQASQGGSQAARAKDSFELVKRFGDVVLSKQESKRKEVSAQVDALLEKLKDDTEELCKKECKEASKMYGAHKETMHTHQRHLQLQLERLLDCYEVIKDNVDTADAAILAAGSCAGSTTPRHMPGTLLEASGNLGPAMDLGELKERAEVLRNASAKIIKEGGTEYEDIAQP